MPRKSHRSDNKPQEPSSSAGEAKGSPKNAEGVVKEVAALGRQVGEALKAAATSEQVKEVGSELTKSLHRVSEKVVDAVNCARESGAGEALGRQFQKVVHTSKRKGAEAGEQLRSNLISGLREIGSELARLAERLDKR